MALNLNAETIVIYVLALKIKTLVNLLKNFIIAAKYLNYDNIFLIEFGAKFLKHNNNNYAIKLENNKQLFYNPIYSLETIELKILKAYIKTNLANGFIWFSKLFANIPILFNQKKNSKYIYVLIMKTSIIL